MSLPTHDPNGRPLSAEARAELMALPEHLRNDPVLVSMANAPVGPPLSDEEREALADCDSDGPWISQEETTRALEEKRRAAEESAAE